MAYELLTKVSTYSDKQRLYIYTDIISSNPLKIKVKIVYAVASWGSIYTYSGFDGSSGTNNPYIQFGTSGTKYYYARDQI